MSHATRELIFSTWPRMAYYSSLPKKEFLFKFSKDRKPWLFWLFEARKRYGLSVLNYMVTSNHHLLVYDTGNEIISKSM